MVGVLAFAACSGTATTITSTAPTTSIATTTTHLPDRALRVPESEPAVIDGVIGVGEWDAAVTVSMSNEVTLLWMYSGDTLYVAHQGDERGAVNLALAAGGELWILHSSAALGSSLYLEGESAWEESHGYTWCCRSPDDESDRLDLLDSEGWQANIGFTGDSGVVEYQVTIPWGDAYAAVVFHDAAGDAAYWPTDLSPNAVEYVVDNRWTDPGFDPAKWWMILPRK